MKMNQKVGFTALSVLLTTSLFTTACSNKTEETQTSAISKPSKQIVNVTQTAEISTLDSTLATDSVSISAMNNVFEGLYRVDKNNRPEPALAKSYTLAPDKKTYTFKLQDAKWSNGDPITAEDFVYAWKRAVNPETGAEYAYLLYDVKNAKKINENQLSVDELGVKAIDEHTFQVELENPVPYFIDLISSSTFFPLNQKFVEGQGKKYGLEANAVLYDGPFIIQKWNHEQKLQLVKNPNYWDKDKVKLQEVNINVVKDVATAVNLYTTKQIDRVDLTGDFVNKYKNDATLKTYLNGRTNFLRLNEKNKMLANPNARKAISLSIDKKGIADEILNNGSVPADYLVPKELAFGPNGKDFQESTSTYEHLDIKKAKDYWEKAKKELGVTNVTLEMLNYDDDSSKLIAEYLKEQLEKNLSGLTINIKQQPNAQKLKLESDMDYDISLSSWGADYPDPMTYLDMFLTNGAFNQTGYSNPKYDDLIKHAKTDLLYNLPKRWEALKEAERILLNDDAVVPLYQKGTSYLQRPYLKDFYVYGPNTYKYAYIKK
ncbi:peptide ABC transporter substrate-binding protein [Gottfriedia acidiceleris]|uniref:peptide ABC transporter substrate-binding protein n=1 Tax=Gottfriedia acidiceleris TaxID=371036 RepID=UPI003B586434